MVTRRTFLGTTAGASIGVTIGGGLVPWASRDIVLAQASSDTTALDRTNADQERVAREILESDFSNAHRLQIVANLRSLANDARVHDRDAVLRNGVQAAVEQFGREEFIARMVQFGPAGVAEKAAELGWDLPLPAELSNPGGTLHAFLEGHLNYSTALHDAADALDEQNEQDDVDENVCAVIERQTSVMANVQGIVCALAGVVSLLVGLMPAAVAAGTCLGITLGVVSTGIVNYFECG